MSPYWNIDLQIFGWPSQMLPNLGAACLPAHPLASVLRTGISKPLLSLITKRYHSYLYSQITSAPTAVPLRPYFGVLYIFPQASHNSPCVQRNLAAGSARHENTEPVPVELSPAAKAVAAAARARLGVRQRWGEGPASFLCLRHLSPEIVLRVPGTSQSGLEPLKHPFQLLYLLLCPESHQVSCENSSGLAPCLSQWVSHHQHPTESGPIPATPPTVISPNPDQSPHSSPQLENTCHMSLSMNCY